MNVVELLDEQVIERADSLAIVEGGRDRRITFAQLAARGEAAAATFASSGLSAGDAVLVFSPMGIDLYVALVGMLRIGLVAAFIDPSNGRAFIERCCAVVRPAALFASPRAHALRLVSPAVRAIPRAFSASALPATIRLGTQRARTPLVPRAPDDPALITFTSGSTGAPKAAARSHGVLAAQLTALSAALRLDAGTVDTATMPIVLLANLAAGVTSLIPGVDVRQPGAADPAALFEQMERYDARSIVASPALLKRLALYCVSRGRSLKGVRRVFAGGAPVFPEQLDLAAAAAPRARITAVYGSTEAEPIADIARDDVLPDDREAMHAGAGLLAGVTVPSIELAIIPNRWGTPIQAMAAAEFEAQRLPAGAPGEIVVSGPHVLPGYLGGIGDAETKFRVDGAAWHRTGDLGYRDTQGRLWLLGRCAGAIHDDRGTLYPFAVECAASDATGVARCAIARIKERRVLFVEAAAGIKPDRDALQRRLAWAQLDEIALLPHIPVDKRHNAKVDYVELARIASRRV